MFIQLAFDLNQCYMQCYILRNYVFLCVKLFSTVAFVRSHIGRGNHYCYLHFFSSGFCCLLCLIVTMFCYILFYIYIYVYIQKEFTSSANRTKFFNNIDLFLTTKSLFWIFFFSFYQWCLYSANELSGDSLFTVYG